jgi:hypothetical protein
MGFRILSMKRWGLLEVSSGGGGPEDIALPAGCRTGMGYTGDPE